MMYVTDYALVVEYVVECSACHERTVARIHVAAGDQLPRPSLPEGWKTHSEVLNRSVAVLCPRHEIIVETYIDGRRQ